MGIGLMMIGFVRELAEQCDVEIVLDDILALSLQIFSVATNLETKRVDRTGSDRTGSISLPTNHNHTILPNQRMRITPTQIRYISDFLSANAH